ncbi:sulfotransferase [Streptomyces sp. NBC_00582]|uniref:sulfotransferase n=1 Tax=Streptomyces sp. NBC_00582 TaxID=2975783 RepID=UPI001062A1BB|nr:sulfotransferase [Streptomyces sp. NBC_00582]WUB63968.1 sulfotransferase [Streptomyces sp. NBC_00582]
MSGPPVRVLYITGWMRSGSTLLGNVLNELPGVRHIGELHFLWKNGVLGAGTNSSCGCGQPLTGCPLWSEALAALPAGGTEATAHRMLALQRKLMRTRHTGARLAEARGARPVDAGVTELLDQSAAVYRGTAAHGADRLVVDGSKCPAEAAALLGRGDLDVKVLHIVRDPRATALSYRSAKEYIDPMSPARSSGYWTAFNLASERVGRQAPDRYLRIRHEDLSTRPRETVAEVLRFAGLDDEVPVDTAGRVTLGVNHTVTGNPDRLRRGVTAIRPDERWRTALSTADIAAATAPALPLLARYGYPTAPGRPSAGGPSSGTPSSGTPSRATRPAEAPRAGAPSSRTAARETGVVRPLWPGELW